jgi:hypothetical protein
MEATRNTYKIFPSNIFRTATWEPRENVRISLRCLQRKGVVIMGGNIDGSDTTPCLIVDFIGAQNSGSAPTVLIICYREGEFPSRDCPKCNEEQCPKPGEDCPQGLVPDICGCCLHGLCGLAEGEKCFNASLSAVLPPETWKYGLCGANLHCLLRPDLTSRVSDFRAIIFSKNIPLAPLFCNQPRTSSGMKPPNKDRGAGKKLALQD